MPGLALHLRNQELSLRDIASRLVITKGKKKGRHPIPGNRRAHAAQARPGSRRKASTDHGPITLTPTAGAADLRLHQLRPLSGVFRPPPL
jgi:hypothetical protein